MVASTLFNSPATARLGVTLGEASGVGPEVVCAALAGLAGDVCATIYVAAHLAGETRARLAAVAPDVAVTVVEVSGGSDVAPRLGHSDIHSRMDAFVALEAMAEAAIAGEIDAMLTGPVPKAIFAHLEPSPAGQTEYLAGRLGVRRFAMMLAGPKLRVVPVTTHMPLRDVAGALRSEAIVEATLAACLELRRVMGIEAPRVGVCGLNPHAGEGGRFGDEETTIIAPALATLRGQGVDVSGPLPADTAFRDAYLGRYDVVIAMYHDQALGPLKTVHFSDAVNFTCGLPVPRLSPDHGTAYDIAGKGVADATSTRAALAIACRAARGRVLALAPIVSLVVVLAAAATGCRGRESVATIAPPPPGAAIAVTPGGAGAAPSAAVANRAPPIVPAAAATPDSSPLMLNEVVAATVQIPRLVAANVVLGPVPPLVVVVATDGLTLNGRVIVPLSCPGACRPPELARVALDDLGRDGEVVVVPRLMQALAGQPGAAVLLFADGRVSARALSQIADSVTAAGALPALAAGDAAGQVVRLALDAIAPETLPDAIATPGSEALPADVQAAVVELDADGVSLILVRAGGGLLRRPLPAVAQAASSTLLASHVATLLATRPELAAMTIDVGTGVSVASLFSTVDALVDPCTRVDGNCAQMRAAASAVTWALRGSAQWSDGADDPARAGRPPPPPPRAELLAPPIAQMAAGAQRATAAPDAALTARQSPAAKAAGLDPRDFLPKGGPRGAAPASR